MTAASLDAPIATYALLSSGVLLMAAPYATRWVKRRFCRFEIVWAFYGFGQTETEVTRQLGSLIRNCRLDFIVHHETFGIADPVPNRRKLLRVGWTNGGAERTGSYGEDAHITLPDPD
jgi:hypothetical protein